MLDNSELVSYCQKTLKYFRCHETSPTQRQFTNVRDYILMYLCLDNASRTGALANMTVREFRRAKLMDGSHRINVINHKTIETSGPACIVATANLFKDMTTYVNMRNQLEGFHEPEVGKKVAKAEKRVFISWSGTQMSSSMVCGQINSFWGKTVGHTAERPRINANLARKSAVSKVHGAHQEMKKDLANLMCHSEDTAKRIYYLQEKTKKAGQTSASLRKVMRQEDPEEKLESMIDMHFADAIKCGKVTLTTVKERKHLSPAFSSISDTSLRDRIRYRISKGSLLKGDDENEDSGEDVSDTDSEFDPSDMPRIAGKVRKERIVFSQDDISDIYDTFGSIITATSSQKVRMREFSRIMKRDGKKLLDKFGRNDYTFICSTSLKLGRFDCWCLHLVCFYHC